jgi:RNA-directed DNA polymerase
VNKRYPVNQSPLYRLHRRKGLADLLGISVKALETLANANPPEYLCFDKTFRKNGKEKNRWIEWPKKPLRRVQKRLARLLDRIEPPNYIQSGFRERSYFENARSHACGVRVAKIDIRGFFPNSSARWVNRCFVEDFQCSGDVTAVLTKLLTIAGHLPTGGNASTIVSFYAYKPMFDEIQGLAVAHGLTMTCCVDDMTFSGAAATSSFLNEVRKIVQRYGLRTHKVHCFESHQPKIITGVALTSKGYRLPNIRRKKLHEAFKEFERERDPEKRVNVGERLLGRATEAAQIEALFQPYVRVAAGMLREAKALTKATVASGASSGSGG